MATNEMICPLCKNVNKCGVNQSTPCWCTEVNVPKALLEQVPDEYINKTCICASCIAIYAHTLNG